MAIDAGGASAPRPTSPRVSPAAVSAGAAAGGGEVGRRRARMRVGGGGRSGVGGRGCAWGVADVGPSRACEEPPDVAPTSRALRERLTLADGDLGLATTLGVIDARTDRDFAGASIHGPTLARGPGRCARGRSTSVFRATPRRSDRWRRAARGNDRSRPGPRRGRTPGS